MQYLASRKMSIWDYYSAALASSIDIHAVSNSNHLPSTKILGKTYLFHSISYNLDYNNLPQLGLH